MQVHYNRGLEADRTTVALKLADSVEEEGIITGVFDVSLSLTPGMAEVTESAALPLPKLDVPVTLHGVYPHMHRYGRSLRAHWDRDGASTCLADVPRYDFDWQQFFFYEEGVTLPPPGGGHFRIECTYDTRGAQRNITWGEGSNRPCLHQPTCRLRIRGYLLPRGLQARRTKGTFVRPIRSCSTSSWRWPCSPSR